MIYALMTVLALLWGLSFLGTKVVLGILTPVEVLAVRWMLAFLLFSLLILFKIIKVDYRGKDLKPLMIAAAIQPCAYALLETWGVNLTTASESSIFIALIPLMVVLQSWLFLKQKVSRKVLSAIVLSFSGVLVCILFAPGFSTGSKFIGYLILIATVVVGAFYTVYTKKINGVYSPMEITYMLTIEGSIFFNVLALVSGHGLHGYQVLFSGGEATVALLFLGIGCSCTAYMIFNYTISRLKAAIASNIQANSITVVGVVAGIVLGGEPWGWYTVVGLIMTIAGIWITSQEGYRDQQAEKLAENQVECQVECQEGQVEGRS